VIEARQRYEPDTAVLVTDLRSTTGVLAVTDALALRPGTDLSDDAPAGRRELIRSAVVLDGSVRVRVEIEPRGGASAHAAAGGLSTAASWRRWMQRFDYEGPEAPLVRRAALTLKCAITGATGR
jgi:hypothetical protein